MNTKQKECEHKNISGLESYGVSGYMEEGTIHLKAGDGGLDVLECEDCGRSFDVSGDEIELEFA
jgi:hypothetical protein